MALLTTLKLKDVSDDYKVADFHLHLSRNYNQFNPESAPTCESIEMTVVAPTTDDYTIYQWYNDDSLLSGKLMYELPVSLNHTYSEIRTIEFQDARCFAFKESYDIDQASRRLLTIRIVPEKVTMEGVYFNKL
jgi:hypothetical protein